MSSLTAMTEISSVDFALNGTSALASHLLQILQVQWVHRLVCTGAPVGPKVPVPDAHQVTDLLIRSADALALRSQRIAMHA